MIVCAWTESAVASFQFEICFSRVLIVPSKVPLFCYMLTISMFYIVLIVNECCMQQ